jgi:hypothetical protein
MEILKISIVGLLIYAGPNAEKTEGPRQQAHNTRREWRGPAYDS